ncbi:ABC transporter ATP-binding protein [Candidatus Darwinibacter acetoxidans]|jgi:multiple sugar transport system ATP-binding protein
MARIVLKNITKKFGQVTAVDNLNLVIEDGSFATLLGPSGCGKTTTLRMLAGLEDPTSGEIWIGDKCVFSSEKGHYVPPGKREMGLVFQSYALWPHLNVFDNIAFGHKIAKRPAQEIKEKVFEIARVLQIHELLDRYPSELSGGQQQRVAIARVLVMKPKVLLLDEPLSNLDSKLRMDMRAELKRLHLETGSTIVYVTHDQLEALTMSSHVAVMDSGRLQQWAPPMEIYNAPANVFTADFIGNPRINLVEGVLKAGSGEELLIEAGELRLPFPKTSEAQRYLNQKVTLGLRAEDMLLSKEPQDGFFKGTVYSVLPAGSEWYVKVQLGEEVLTVTIYSDLDLRLDEPIWLGVQKNKIKCFNQNGAAISPGVHFQKEAASASEGAI